LRYDLPFIFYLEDKDFVLESITPKRELPKSLELPKIAQNHTLERSLSAIFGSLGQFWQFLPNYPITKLLNYPILPY